MTLVVVCLILAGGTRAGRAWQQDENTAAAQRAFQAAKELNEQGTPDSLRASIGKFQEASELFRAAGDPGDAAFMLLFVGRTYYDLGEKQKAIDLGGQAQTVFHQLGNVRMEAGALTLIGTGYFDLEQRSQALDSYQKVLALWESLGDKNKQALAWSNLGLVYYAMGDKEKALDAYEKAIGFVNEVDDPAVKARMYASLGELHAELGQGEFAHGFLQVAVGIYKRLGNDEEANRLTEVLHRVSLKESAKPAAAARAAVTGKPELVVQLGHSSFIMSICVSPDGRYVLTGSADETARLWEASTGTEIKKFEGHRAAVMAVAFTPDGRNILTASQDATVRLWDLTTGQVLRQFTGQRDEMTSVAVSGDGRLVAAGNGMKVQIWELATGRNLREISFPARVNAVAFSPDGKRIVAGTGDALDPSKVKELMLGQNGGANISDEDLAREIVRQAHLLKREVVLCDTDTGDAIWRFASPASPVNAVAFSGDGSFVISASGGVERVDNFVRLFDSTTGRERRRFTQDHSVIGPEPLLGLSLSPDGRQALVISTESARLWDLETGSELHQFKHGATGPMGGTISRDGQIAIGYDQTVDLFAASTGNYVRSLEGYAYESSVMAVSPDGRFIATGNGEAVDRDHLRESGTVCLWDTTLGKEVRRFEGHESRINSLVFAADGRSLLTGSWDQTARLWDVETGKELVRFEAGENGDSIFSAISAVALSRDGRFALTGSKNMVALSDAPEINYARLWDTATGREIMRYPHQDGVNSVAISPDNRFVLTGSGGEAITNQGTPEDRPAVAILWDRETAHEIRRFAGNRAGFSPDGKLVLTAGADNAAHLWETETGREVRKFDSHTGAIDALTFSADGRTILTGGVDQSVRVWDVATGQALAVLAAHSGSINSVSFSGDGRFVYTFGQDSLVRIWDRASGAELCRLISFRDGTWVAVDPSGRFDTNNLEEIRGLHWSMADEPLTPLPLEIFMRQYYEPRLAQRVMAGEKFSPVKGLADLDRVQPKVSITSIEPQPGHPDQVTVTVEVARSIGDTGRSPAQKTDVYDLRLFRDGQLVGQAPSASLANAAPSVPDELPVWRRNTQVKLDSQGKASVKFENIRLPHQPDQKQAEFSAYAFNVDQVKSETSRRSFALPPERGRAKGRAFIITVGVNAYENPDFDLEFAASDARRMLQVMTERLAATGQYDEVVPVSLISDYATKGPAKVVTAKQATKANIQSVLQLLSKRGKTADLRLPAGVANLDKLRTATPDDLVLIMFSSHGYADRDGNFYFIPYDTGPGTGKFFTGTVRRHSISSVELSQWLAGVDAGEMVLIVDACHSAAAIEGQEFKPGPMGSRGLGQLSYDKGMRILTATQSDTVALENGLIRQGLLTYALLHDGIEARQADFRPHDNSIKLSEWLNYGVDRVPKLYEELRAGKVQDFGLADNPTTVVVTIGSKGLVEVVGAAAIEAKTQQPSLFDFAPRRRDVVLIKEP